MLGWVVALVAASGGTSGLAALVAAQVTRRKVSADADVSTASAADQIVQTAMALMEPLTNEVGRAREEAEQARQQAVAARAEAEQTRRHLAQATAELDTMRIALAELRAQCDEERRDMTFRITQLQLQIATGQ